MCSQFPDPSRVFFFLPFFIISQLDIKVSFQRSARCGQEGDRGRLFYFLSTPQNLSVHLRDDIPASELFKALSSTLGQFPPVGILDWENGGPICERQPQGCWPEASSGGDTGLRAPPGPREGRSGHGRRAFRSVKDSPWPSAPIGRSSGK